MVKNQRSSASSGTRKKHAKKAAISAGDVVESPLVPKQKKPRGKEKARLKAEPKKKVYIPPVRPQAIHPDPLDTLGIAYSISSELLVVLRKLGKKDAVTKIRALEELQSGWILKAMETSDPQLLEEISTVLPVWLHHLPGLFLHHSRRIRILSGGLHALFLVLPGVKVQLFTLIRDLEEERQETVIGSWCLLIHDIEGQVSLTALPSWEDNFGSRVNPDTEGALLIREIAPALISFIRQTIFDPLGAYSVVNPVQPSIDTKPAKKGPKFQPRVQEPPEPPSADEEPEAERKARIRAGGLGSVKYVLAARNLIQPSEPSWEAIEETLSGSLLWTSLHSGERSPSDDSESFGFEQPIVRRAAWSLLLSVLQERKGELDAILPILSVSILRSAWIEPDVVVRTSMWQPLLKFLTEYPQCWELDARFRPDADESESESEADPGLPPSTAYKDFLRFLELGCRGSPRQGYPALVIVLSTIPHPIITSLPSESPLDDLFTSIWSAVDSRAFGTTDKTQTFSAFTCAFVDCLLLFSKRLQCSTSDVTRSLIGGSSEADGVDSEHLSGSVLLDFVRKQTARFVQEIFQGRLRLDPPAAIKPLSDVITKLDEVDKDLPKMAWDCVSDVYIQLLQRTSQLIDVLHFRYLKELQNSAAGALFESSMKSLIHQTFNIVIGTISKDFDASSEHQDDYFKAGSILRALLDVWGKDGLEDPKTSILLCAFMEERLPQVVRCGPLLVSTYLGLLPEQPGNTYWHQVLNVIVSRTTGEALDWLDKFNGTNPPRYLHPSQDFELFVQKTITMVLEDGTSHLRQAVSLLERSDVLLTKGFLQPLFRSLCESFVPIIQETLRVPSVPSVQIERHLIFLESTLFRYLDDEQLWDVYQSLLPEVFLLGSLINEDEDSSNASSICLNIWSGFLARGPENLLSFVKPNLRARLQFHVESVVSWSRPIAVFKAASKLSGNMGLGIMDLVPPREKLDSILSALHTEPADASISLRSPLLPLSGLEDPPLVSEENFDLDGYSSYARIISLLLDAFLEDRIVAKAHPWALQHFTALAIYAEEALDLPNSSSEIFDAKTVSPFALRQLVHKVQRMTTYILSDVGDAPSWHRKVTAACKDAKVQLDVGEIGQLVTGLLRAAVSSDNPRDARILHTILQHILSHTSKEEGDLWMDVCRKIETKAPFASMAVVLSVAGSGSEPPRLDRHRNELAANALGVRSAKINTEGLWTLRRLVVTAPDPDSDIIFIPQTRAVNFMKACQQWVTSDEDIEEEVESQMTVLFYHLAPILQHVPGSHWDFIFDVVENNLENFVVEEPSTIVTLARSLQTILKIIDLATTNRVLRANWEARNNRILTLVRDIVTAESGVQSGPLSTCRELLLTVAQNLPPSLIEIDTLGKATHLLNDKSVGVQKMAYQLLHTSAKKRTEYIVIEAGVLTPDSDMIKPELPPELVAFLQQSIDEDDPDAPPTFGYLLGWMSVFDLFVDASLKVKIAYINHLRDLEMITSHFLPAAFRMFDLYSGITSAPKLDVWGIDEYHVPYYEEQNPLSVVLLCAHLYYRALQTVPTLVRLWILECKDRNLSTAVTTYTSKYFSSVIINAELERVITTRLGDDKMDVKVISVHREVNTTYTIDESEIKMSLRMPPDWPLHVIEVRGVKKVGVKEDRWNAWISGVRQVVLTQGNVVDGLELFKKNVSAHFENKTECAICYSLISATDGNLPNKPCQTCKNSFHASCLYEWFKSSHSSSCPLCRSNFIK